jgi:hypothetical protein
MATSHEDRHLFIQVCATYYRLGGGGVFRTDVREKNEICIVWPDNFYRKSCGFRNNHTAVMFLIPFVIIFYEYWGITSIRPRQLSS